jgi:hypothetical protein
MWPGNIVPDYFNGLGGVGFGYDVDDARAAIPDPNHTAKQHSVPPHLPYFYRRSRAGKSQTDPLPKFGAGRWILWYGR